MKWRQKVAKHHADTIMETANGIADLLRACGDNAFRQDDGGALGSLVKAVYDDSADRARTIGLELAEHITEAVR